MLILDLTPILLVCTLVSAVHRLKPFDILFKFGLVDEVISVDVFLKGEFSSITLLHTG